MKKTLFFTLVLLIITGCISLVRPIPDGVYEGTGTGHRGLIHVLVRVAGGNITEIDIIDSVEDRFVGGEAIEELLDLVIQYNTTDLDAISGATESSRGFLKAVEDAIMKHD